MLYSKHLILIINDIIGDVSTNSDFIRNSFSIYNEHVVSAMYDLMNKVHTNVVVQLAYQKDERGSFNQNDS